MFHESQKLYYSRYKHNAELIGPTHAARAAVPQVVPLSYLYRQEKKTIEPVHKAAMLKLESSWIKANEVYLYPRWEINTSVSARPTHLRPKIKTSKLWHNRKKPLTPRHRKKPLNDATNNAKDMMRLNAKRKLNSTAGGNSANKSRKLTSKSQSKKPANANSTTGNDNSNNKKQGKSHLRVKWSDGDVELMWRAISLHGNKWSLIKHKVFPRRTNDQVKDKGKRLLRKMGWVTGTTKTDAFCACKTAKELASGYFQRHYDLHNASPTPPPTTNTNTAVA